MSVRIKLSNLTEENKKDIRKDLIFQHKKKFFRQNNFYSNSGPDPIQFYWEDKPNNEIILPYTYGNMLMKTNINSEGA